MAVRTTKNALNPINNKWIDENYLRIYHLARAGYSNTQIARALEVSWKTFCNWQSKKPAIKKTLEEARGKENQQSFQDYVYDRLTPTLKALWRAIRRYEREGAGVAKIEALLEDAGIRARQHLFIHALLRSNFNKSEACRRVNISKTTFDNWCKNDPDFPSLIDEMRWHMGNFFEEPLVELVQMRHPGIVKFVNETFNADRGYGRKTEVRGKIEHDHDHQHVHAHVKIDDLNLPLETRKEILEAMDKQRALPVHNGEEIIDGEFTAVTSEDEDD